MYRLYDAVTHVFDPLHAFWEHPRTQRTVAGVLAVVFVLGLGLIELNRQGLLPGTLGRLTPTSHFGAVNLAFTLVLVLEVIGFIFALPCSVSKSVGKQLEILALILLRNSFKELIHFGEPIELAGHMDALYRIAADGTGALLIFLALGFYYRVLRHAPTITDPVDRYRFVATKKAVSLVLLVVFVATGGYDLWLMVSGGHPFEFFEAFYTVLIFSDILLVLVSHQYLPAFHAVFRNSGYALSTLLMRLALAAPAYVNAAIGVGAAAFAVVLTLVYNAYFNQAGAHEPGSMSEVPVDKEV
jgi:hypothetical protein